MHCHCVLFASGKALRLSCMFIAYTLEYSTAMFKMPLYQMWQRHAIFFRQESALDVWNMAWLNAGLMGQMIDAPAASIADLCLVQLQETKLQNACATPGTHQTVTSCCTVWFALADLFTCLMAE